MDTSEEEINTLLNTQRMLTNRSMEIAQMAEDYAMLCGSGFLVREFRNAFLKIANIANGRNGDQEIS